LRAEAEMLMHPKTIFFTGTWAKQTDDIDEVNEEVKRWLKRVRYYKTKRISETSSGLRYLVIPERHKSGKWHVHALLHGDNTLSTRMVGENWWAGFTYERVADLGAARYVTKYLCKDLIEADDGVKRPRIKASRARYLGKKLEEGFHGPEVKLSDTYGGWVMVRDEELVKKLLAERGTEWTQEVWQKNLQMMLRELKKEVSLSRRVSLSMSSS
jgi:hypothetical protein